MFSCLLQICLLAPRSISKTTSGKIARAWCRRAFIAGSLQLLHRADNTAVATDVEAAGAQGSIRLRFPVLLLTLHHLYFVFSNPEFSSRGNVLGYSPLPDDADADAENPKENAQEPKKPSRNGSTSSTCT